MNTFGRRRIRDQLLQVLALVIGALLLADITTAQPKRKVLDRDAFGQLLDKYLGDLEEALTVEKSQYETNEDFERTKESKIGERFDSFVQKSGERLPVRVKFQANKVEYTPDREIAYIAFAIPSDRWFSNPSIPLGKICEGAGKLGGVHGWRFDFWVRIPKEIAAKYDILNSMPMLSLDVTISATRTGGSYGFGGSGFA